MTQDTQQGNLPRGWAWATVGEVTTPRGMKVKPADMPDAPFIGLEHIEAHTMKLLGMARASDVRSPASYFASGDILYGRLRPYLNKVHRPEYEGLASGEFIVFPDHPLLHNPYFQYFLNQWEFVSFVTRLNTGDRPRVDFGQFSDHPIPVASLPEQRRIVAEIEKQFTRLDASVAALRRTQANLKRYRASVLRAACSGELVSTEAELARAEGREYEPAGVLLGRILAERRARWESQENRRGKYKEPAAPDTSDLPPLPEGWTWATVDQMIVRSEYGTSVKCSYESDGIPVLRIPNIVGSEIDLTDLKFANQSLPVDDDRALQVGDVLMCRTNGSISLIGKTAVIKRPLEPHHSFASYLLRFRFVDCPPLSDWFHLFTTSQLGRNYIEREAASSAGQHNVSLSLIHRMAVPVPPLAEQHRIVAEVERRLSVIQQAETAVEASVQRAERLRQSILKRAFAGELVPQDPRDEPASVLLERIRAQREVQQAVSATKKRPARRRRATPKAQQLTLEEASA